MGISIASATASTRPLVIAAALAYTMIGCGWGGGPLAGEPCGPAAQEGAAEVAEQGDGGATGDDGAVAQQGDGAGVGDQGAVADEGTGGDGAAGGAAGDADGADEAAEPDPLDDAGSIDDDGLPGFPYALAIDPDLPSRAWFTIDRGLLVSDDGGVSWEQLQSSKIMTGRMIVALRPPGGDLIVAGPGVLRRSEDDGATWIDMPGPVAPDRSDAESVSAPDSDAGGTSGGDDSAGGDESSGDDAAGGDETDSDSVSGGDDVSSGDSPSGGDGESGGDDVVGVGPDIRGLAQDPSAPSTLHALIGDGTVQRSDDAGATWRVVGERAPAGAYGLWPVAASPTVLWTVSLLDRSICRSDDGGERWARVEPEGLTGQLQAITLADDGVAYAATIAGLYRSDDGGATWEARGPFRAVIGAATQLDRSDTVLVIVFGGGIFKSEDGGLTWGQDGDPDGGGEGGDGESSSDDGEGEGGGDAGGGG